MKYRIVPSPDAEADVTSASWWYHNIDPNLATRFVADGRATVASLAQFPYRFRLVNGTVRRARMRRFPYAVYYAVKGHEVLITAVLHQRRSDGVWKQRSRR